MNQKLFELIYIMIVRQELKPQDAYDMLRDFFRLTEISEREKVNEQKPEVHQWEPIDLSKWPGRIIDNPQQPYLGTWCGDSISIPSVSIRSNTGDVTSNSATYTNGSTCTCTSANAATTACVSSADSSIESDLTSATGPFESSANSSFQTVPATKTD